MWLVDTLHDLGVVSPDEISQLLFVVKELTDLAILCPNVKHSSLSRHQISHL